MSTLLLLLMALAQSDPSGHWEATVQVPNGPNRVDLDLAKNDKGAWIASLAVPQQNATGLRVTDITVDGQKLRFNAPEVPGGPKFVLTFEADKMTGTVTVREMALPVEMKRTGEAKVELQPSNPAVSKALEGDWEGAITLPSNGQKRPISLHFKNQPDQTVMATLDSGAQGLQGLALSGVKQNGDTVEFFLRAGGRYKGTLNKKATELAGEWIQRPDAAPLPLTFKKK